MFSLAEIATYNGMEIIRKRSAVGHGVSFVENKKQRRWANFTAVSEAEVRLSTSKRSD